MHLRRQTAARATLLQRGNRRRDRIGQTLKQRRPVIRVRKRVLTVLIQPGQRYVIAVSKRKKTIITTITITNSKRKKNYYNYYY